MSGQSLSMALWSLATLNARSPASHAFITAAIRHLKEGQVSFDALGSQGVANSLWAAAKLNHHDEQLLAKGVDWVAQHLQSCKLQEVLNVLWAAGACRYRPPVLGSIARHVAGQSQALKPADVASLFHVLGIFGFDFSTKPDILQQLLPRATELLPQMKPLEITSLYWGLGLTRQVDSALFRQLTDMIAKLHQQQEQAALQLQQQPQLEQQRLRLLQQQAKQLPGSLQRQAFQAYIAARLEEVAIQLPVSALQAFRDAWIAGNSSKRQQQSPLLADVEWMLQQLRIKAQVATRSKLNQLLTVDIELNASGGRVVALQLLADHSTDTQGAKLAPVQWEEDVLRRNGYDDVYWLRVEEYKRCPKEKRVRYVADVLRKLGINPQELLLKAAEKGWVEGGRMDGKGSATGANASSRAAARGSGGSWDAVGAGGIRASEADVLLQERGGRSSNSKGGVGGWASGGRGSRSRRGAAKRR
eukprot:GHRR01006755.1.p1 GENE.GHRR01006755.1~~GHRR01006755.1.p1  ORF type:complete len:510 (+),score=197.47 GHRR01006755.1:113-1531(+)